MFKRSKLITFDIIGTIVRFKEPPTVKYVEVAADHGVIVDQQAIQNSFYSNWKQLDRQHPHFGSVTKMSSTRWWFTLVNETFKDVLQDEYDEGKMSKVAAHLYSYYHSPKPYLVLEDSLETLNRIKTDHKHITVGAMSNFDNRLHDIVPSLGLKQYFDFVVTSEDARASKPDTGIFDYTRVKAGTVDIFRPSEILHVGDDMDKDYCGARGVGWNALLVDRHGGGYTLIEEEHIIQNLTEIFDK